MAAEPQLKTVRLKVDAKDTCGKVKTKIVRIRSNEAIDGKGDGNTRPDWIIVDSLVVRLRAERAGGGSGRIYTIVVKATDEAGNSTIGRTQVRVPHSMGNEHSGDKNRGNKHNGNDNRETNEKCGAAMPLDRRLA